MALVSEQNETDFQRRVQDRGCQTGDGLRPTGALLVGAGRIRQAAGNARPVGVDGAVLALPNLPAPEGGLIGGEVAVGVAEEALQFDGIAGAEGLSI